MGLKEILDENILPAVEVALKAYITDNFDKHTEFVLEALKKAIPGQWDDKLIDSKKEEIAAFAKDLALKQADLISGKV